MIKGSVSDRRTGSVKDIIRALSGPWSSAFVTNGNGNMMVQDVATSWPVIIGLRENRRNKDEIGHVFVLYGIYLSWGHQGQAVIDEVELYDPWPGNGYTEMSAEELKSKIVFAVHMHRAFPGY
ncbi:MAG: hypothetical protein GY797_04135 [Deltaproteobacteria bacterium]|nr:hypothetical protein [Deltaproteobacteria bacterium]